MAREADVYGWLLARTSIDEAEEFLRRFGGYRVPKRSEAITRARNKQILVACLVRMFAARTLTLTDAIARSVASEFGSTEKSVRSRWYAWNRIGAPRIGKGGSTEAATTPDTFRW